MLAKHSVKRPYTVFVAVILVLVLGVISFFGMTTDLLPSLDLPYVVVVTTYPGASPEKIELTVTKPLESVLGTASGLTSVNSVSQENSSMVILEFEQGTNMDSAMIELSGSIDLLKSQLADGVGSPMMMKISPDMMPIMVASIDRDGYDTLAVSAFAKDSVVPAFERVDGVASVGSTGLVSEQVTVTLDAAKISALNEKLKHAIDDQLTEAQNKITDGKAKLADGKAKLTSGKTELASKKASTFSELAAASAKVDSAAAQLTALLAQETTLNANKTACEAILSSYDKVNGQIADLSAAAAGMGQVLPRDIPGMVALGADTYNRLVTPVLTLISPDLAAALTYDSLAGLAAGYETAKNELAGITLELQTMSAMKASLEDGLKQAQAGYEKLESGKLTAVNEITKAEVALSTTETQLSEAESSLADAQKQFDDAKKAAYEKADLTEILTPSMIGNILMAQNFSMPAGYLSEGADQYLVKVGDAFSTSDQIADVMLMDMGEDSIGVIRLSDVAQVEVTNNADDSYAKINGNDGVVMSFQKQSTASTANVADKINETIAELQARYDGLHITPLMDQGQYIHIITDSVMQNLLVGGVLAILVLIVFLKDAKPTLIIACSIPISLLFAVTLMYFTGVNLNIISLSGLALGVGMLVDNSIVVIENIYRLRAKGLPAAKAAVQGANQVAGAIFASTLTTVCVFLPIVFTQGISRQLFTDMGLTIGYSLMASLVVALTLVPAMGSTVLKKTNNKSHRWFDAFTAAYEKVLRAALNHRFVTLAAAAALLCVAVFGTTVMGTAFIPQMDSPEMSLTMSCDKQTEVADVRAMSDELIRRVSEIDGVKTVGAMSGGDLMGMGGGSDSSITMYLLLSENRELTSQQISSEILARSADLDCTVEVTSSSMDMSALGGSGIQVQIKGRELDTLRSSAKEIAALMQTVPGLTDIDDGAGDAASETRVTVNKDAAMKKGLTVAQVYSEIAAALKSETSATTLSAADKDYPVVVVDTKNADLTRQNLADYKFTVTDKDGEEDTFSLSEIATVTQEPGISAVRRADNSRYMTVSAAVDDGYNIGLVSRDFEKVLNDYTPPAGYTVEIAGENETIVKAMIDLVKMISLAIVFIYLIMVAQFQSLLSPFIVLFTLPLAFTGGLLLLWASGSELSVIAMLGFLVLAGVVVNNGIVFVDYTNQLCARGMDKREALIACGRTRLRPILMTALTTILAMSTMALGIGQGAEMTQPMAIVTVGGLSYATLLTLLVVPVMYDLLCRKKMQQVDLGEDDDD